MTTRGEERSGHKREKDGIGEDARGRVGEGAGEGQGHQEGEGEAEVVLRFALVIQLPYKARCGLCIPPRNQNGGHAQVRLSAIDGADFV